MLHYHQLHQYQLTTINHMVKHPHSMIYLDLGLGKTVSTLTAFSFLRGLGAAGAMLVVAPLRVCQLVWRQEGKKWGHLNHLKFANMTGAAKKRQRALFGRADVYLVNYESLGWLATQLQHYFINKGKALPFDVLAWDEVSKIKRSQSKRFESFAPVLPYFQRRIGLTASPCSNGLQDMWGQFYMVDGGQRLGTSYRQFQSRYFHQVGYGHMAKWEPYSDTRDMIVSRINDITIEMKARDHLDMPGFSVVDIEIELPPKLMKEYKKLENDFFIELDSGETIEAFNKAALSNKLLQFSDGIVYQQVNPDDPTALEERFVHDEKYQALDELMFETGDEPILLAYSFRCERNEILKRYPQAECLVGVSEEAAIDIQARFNAGLIKLLIAHPLSAAHGLNLQQSCHILVWFGLNYNLELYEQFIGRINRQGQQHPVQCFRIVCKNTMDYAVMDALEHKDHTQKGLRDAIGRYRHQPQGQNT